MRSVEMNKPCYVYVIGIDGDWGGLEAAVKIGIAKDPISRLTTIQTGCPASVSIKRKWRFPTEVDARQFEVACHKRFIDKRSLREWFFVSPAEVAEFYEQFGQILKDNERVEDASLRLAQIAKLARLIGAKVAPDGLSHEAKPCGSGLLSTLEAAAHLGKSASWLNKSRMNGTGPIYIKAGGNVRYSVDDLDAWLEANKRSAVYDFANSLAGLADRAA